MIDEGYPSDELHLQDVLKRSLQSNELPSSRADVTLIKRHLETCSFNDKANSTEDHDDITLEALSGIFDKVVANQGNKSYDQQHCSYVWLHISAHGFYDENYNDTFLRFKHFEAVSIKEIIYLFYSKILNKSSVKLMITVDACRKSIQIVNRVPVVLPEEAEFVVLYSTLKGLSAYDTGSDTIALPGEYTSPTPFSKVLAQNISVGINVMDVFKCTKESVSNKWGVTPDIEGSVSFTL